MENKTLSADQINALKETIRQRFDDLYQRIGKNRQNLLNKVLFVHHQINKELAKEAIDADHEKDILKRVRDTERAAENQLPHVHKMVHPTTPVVPSVAVTPAAPKPPKPAKEEKPAKEPKPVASKPVEPKAKEKAKPKSAAKPKSESKGQAKASAAKKKKK